MTMTSELGRRPATPDTASPAGPSRAAADEEGREAGRALRGDQVAVALRGLAAAYVALTVPLALLGLALVRVLDDTWIVEADRSITEWIAAHRLGFLDSIAAVIGRWAATWSIVLGAAGSVLVLAAVRAWRSAGVIVGGLLLEITVFLSVNWVVARPRPNVEHLASVPSTASFPSGHAAAAVVLYGAWAVTVRRVGTVRGVHLATALIAVAFPVLVACSRVYQGVHHPMDVVAGAAMGASCLALALRICRPLPDALADRGPDAGRTDEAPAGSIHG